MNLSEKTFQECFFSHKGGKTLLDIFWIKTKHIFI